MSEDQAARGDALLAALETHDVAALQQLLASGLDPRQPIRGALPVPILLEMYMRSGCFAACLQLLRSHGGTLPEPGLAPVERSRQALGLRHVDAFAGASGHAHDRVEAVEDDDVGVLGAVGEASCRQRDGDQHPHGAHAAFIADLIAAVTAPPPRPPRRVAFGQASNDEMATLTIAMTVADRAARATLDAADVARQLEKAPDAWNVLLRHARLARERGDFAAARQAIERARTISPGAADCALEAGILADVENRLDERAARIRTRAAPRPRVWARAPAARHTARPAGPRRSGTRALRAGAAMAAERAVELDPDYFGPWFNLGRVGPGWATRPGPARRCCGPRRCARAMTGCRPNSPRWAAEPRGQSQRRRVQSGHPDRVPGIC
jgi:hypothetical protein